MGWRIELLEGDCRGVLPSLEAQSVQCCVTSPPYWGLRDYGTAAWEGGDQGCDHVNDHTNNRKMVNGRGEDTGINCTSWTTRDVTVKSGGNCPRCGARRIDAQLGLEETPEEYIAKMVSVFREVGRVLRDDGTLWVNMGDTYASASYSESRKEEEATEGNKGYDGSYARRIRRNTGIDHKRETGLKPKDLCGIPWRLAFALQADGWYLRSDIIWNKKNPLPESVTDRPTKSHEYIFLLTKAERYFYDAAAIREPADLARDRTNVTAGFF
jgi:DNA modification methylase